MVVKINLKNGIAIKIFILLFFSIVVLSQDVFGTPWWNTSYEFRQEIVISTSSASTTENHQIELNLNNSLVGANFNWSRNCNDIRILDNQTKLHYWIEDCNSVLEEAKLWVNSSENITTSNKTLHLYYGNSHVLNESNGSKVFDFFDDFSGDLSKWTKHKTPNKISIVNNYLQISGATQSAPYGHSVLGSSATYNNFLDGIIEGKMYLDTNAIAEIGFRGNYGSNIGYKSRADARGSEGVSHLRPPYNGWGFTGGGAVGGGVTTHTWLPFKITAVGSSLTIDTDAKTKTVSDGTYTNAGEISLHNHYGLYSRFDDIRVRKYFSNSILISFGIEESLGLIDFSFINPLPNTIGYVQKDSTFNVSANISCRKKAMPYNCGNLNFNLRYNDSVSTFNNISLIPSTPLWVMNSLQTCSLNDGDSCIISWLVNGSGNNGDLFLLGILSSNSSDNYTFNQESQANSKLSITTQPVVLFNQSTYDFGTFLKNSGTKNSTFLISSNFGANTNISLTCESGNCSRFTNDWIMGTNMIQGELLPISFSCLDSQSGLVNATFSISSNENPSKSLLTLNCHVQTIYELSNPQLLDPLENTLTSVRQNSTFLVNASVLCEGECSNISAYVLYNNSISMWEDINYNYRQNISLNSSGIISSGHQILLPFNQSSIGPNFNWSNNCEDITFYKENIELFFWVESCNTTNFTMNVWVRVDDEITTSIYDFNMYYGFVNSSKSNASNVFDFFDDFDGSNIDLNRWNILYNEGWSVSAGELIGTNTNGILHSIDTFSGPIVLETKTKMNLAASGGQMTLGFYGSSSNAVGILESSASPSQYNYRNDAGWSVPISINTLYNYHINEISIDSLNNVELRVKNLDYSILDIRSFSNIISNEYIGLGRRYDNGNLAQTYDQRWDWVRTRKYSPNTISVTMNNEEKLNLVSTNIGDSPFFTLDNQPQTCISSENMICYFTWTLNATGPINSNHTLDVLFLSNNKNVSSIVTKKANITIIDFLKPEIHLLTPINSTKLLLGDLVEFKFSLVDLDSPNLNYSLFLDNNSLFNGTSLSNVNISLNLSLQSGFHSWYVQATDGVNSETSLIENFYYIKKYNKSIRKNIVQISPNIYRIKIITSNLNPTTSSGKIIDWVDSTYNYGSFNILPNWINLSLSNPYTGSVLGSNINWISNTSFERNYSITGVGGNGKLRKNYMVGLE